MKVLFVSRSTAKGNVPPIIFSQGESLKKKGVDLEYYVVGNNGFSSYIKAIGELRRIIRDKKIHLVHVHYGVSGIALLIARVKVKKVLSLMGSDILATKNDYDKNASLGHALTKVIKWTLPFYDGLIVKSEGMQRALKNIHSDVIPNGVSFEHFKPMDKFDARKRLNLDNSDTVLLFPANKNRNVKNYKLFDQAVSIVKESIPDLKIIWFDNIPHEETLYFFNASNAVVLTSIHEGSPNVIKEAMACNIPIVSVDVGDVRQVISGTEGCFIAAHDAPDLANKILKVLEFDRTKGRENVNHLDSNLIAAKIIDKYKRIIEA